MQQVLEIGSPAPAAEFIRDGGDQCSLLDFKGKKVVLYFYPKADTSGCTREAQDFTCLEGEFAKVDALVIGLSKDPISAHNKFRDKYDLKVILGSDSTDICERYGVWVEKSMYGRKYMGIERATFLIDENGIITHIWRNVKVPNHAAEVLARLK